MKRTLALMFLAVGPLILGTAAASQAASTPVTWTISYAGVGPARINMTVPQAEATGHFTTGGCGPQLRGAPGKVAVAWFGGAHMTLKALFVTGASSGNYRFATMTGVHVGSTVAQLKRRETGLAISTKKVYAAYVPGGYAYVYYQHSGRNRWMMYVLPSTINSPRAIRPTTKLSEIAVSNYRLGAMGGC